MEFEDNRVTYTDKANESSNGKLQSKPDSKQSGPNKEMSLDELKKYVNSGTINSDTGFFKEKKKSGFFGRLKELIKKLEHKSEPKTDQIHSSFKDKTADFSSVRSGEPTNDDDKIAHIKEKLDYLKDLHHELSKKVDNNEKAGSNKVGNDSSGINSSLDFNSTMNGNSFDNFHEPNKEKLGVDKDNVRKESEIKSLRANESNTEIKDDLLGFSKEKNKEKDRNLGFSYSDETHYGLTKQESMNHETSQETHEKKEDVKEEKASGNTIFDKHDFIFSQHEGKQYEDFADDELNMLKERLMKLKEMLRSTEQEVKHTTTMASNDSIAVLSEKQNSPASERQKHIVQEKHETQDVLVDLSDTPHEIKGSEASGESNKINVSTSTGDRSQSIVSDDIIFDEKEKSLLEWENKLKKRELELNRRELDLIHREEELNSRYSEFLEKYNFILEHYDELVKLLQELKATSKGSRKKIKKNASKKNALKKVTKVKSKSTKSKSSNTDKKTKSTSSSKSKSKVKSLAKSSVLKSNSSTKKKSVKKANASDVGDIDVDKYNQYNAKKLYDIIKGHINKKELDLAEKLLEIMKKKVKKSTPDELLYLELNNDLNLAKIEMQINQSR